MPKVCENVNCEKRAYYGFIKTPIMCKDHIQDGMFNLVCKRCRHEGCRSQPKYNFKDTKKGLYCKKHIKEGMVDVVGKKCLQNGCEARPTFNVQGGKGLYCKYHKLTGMIDVENNHCRYENCKARPSFNFGDQKTGIYCKDHKENGMIDVVNRRCLEKDCQARPSFNVKGEKKGLYCKDHIKVGMINVLCRQCLHENCELIPSFNFEGESIALYCKDHIKVGMVDIMNKRCLHNDCIKQPSFNFEGEKAILCNDHKEKDMINVVAKRCSLCKTMYAQNIKYKGLCFRCFTYSFPNESISRNYKIKEKHVHDFICSQYAMEKFSYDKSIDNGCSKRRPDWFFECFTHVVIIECDENQHTEYDNTCENKRIMELFTDIGNRPLIMIRFNPDAYFKDNEKMPSSFKYHKTLGVPMIRDKNEWLQRLTILKENIDNSLSTIPEKEISLIHLFYDE